MADHTPGEWRVVENWGAIPSINNARIYAGDIHVASMSRTADKPFDQKRADARLISASPRMFDYIKQKADEGDSDAAQIIASIT